MSADVLPIGTPVIALAHGGDVMIGTIEACGLSVPGLGAGAYSVRLDDGQGIWCLPAALFDLRRAGPRPAIAIARRGGHA